VFRRSERFEIEAVVEGAFDIAEDVFGCLHVENRGIREVLGEFGDSKSEVRASVGGKVADGANDFAV